MAAFVGYYRVSTAGQGRSGLSLDAQREAVSAYVASVGGHVVADFSEVDSGANSERSQLRAAMRACRVSRAMLVIAKLDRLARNVHFITTLMEAGVDFIAADMPTANKLTIHIIAAMAEYEREAISQRTKAALAAAKARGVKLGNPRIAEGSARALATKRQKADEFAKRVFPHIAELQRSGLSLTKMALILEANDVPTARGGRWSAAAVGNVLKRIRALEASPSASADA